MTREEAKQMLPVIQAYAKGKDVQYYNSRDERWCECGEPNFRSGSVWRVKPDPTYRAFESQEECWAEMQKHQPLGWVIVDGCKKSISSVTETYVFLNGEQSARHYEYMVKSVFFADGTPFGIQK